MLGAKCAQLATFVHKHVVLTPGLATAERVEVRQARTAEALDAAILLLADSACRPFHLFDGLRDVLHAAHALHVAKLDARRPQCAHDVSPLALARLLERTV